MTVSRRHVSRLSIAFAAVVFISVSGVEAGEGDHVQGTSHLLGQIGDHCSQFGGGFVDVGNGICGRVSAHVRVYGGTRNAAIDAPVNGWTSGGTSNAALRTSGMVPGAEVTHLRVRGGLDSLSPFQ